MCRHRSLRLLSRLAVASLLVQPLVVMAQQAVTIADLHSGKSLPVSMKPQDLPDDYKPVKLKSAGGSGGMMDLMGMMMPFAMLFGGLAGGGGDKQSMALFQAAEISWTKGDVVSVQGKPFLVTYKWDLNLTAMAASGAETAGEEGAPSLKDTTLTLTLAAVDGITQISPVEGFSKADLIKVLEAGLPAKSAPTVEAPQSGEVAVAEEPPGTPDQEAGLKNAKQLCVALMMYVTDYDDVTPYAQSTKAVQMVTFPYLKSAESWKTMNPAKSEFRYNIAVGGVSMSALDEPGDIVFFYESKAWADGRRMVAFADGSARLVSGEEWTMLEGSLNPGVPKSAKPLPLNYGMDWTPPGG